MNASETGPIEVGDSLKKARAQKGLSLESVQQKTRIPRKYLEAMEESRFEDFPATVYLRGFLKNYCEFLDLEFDPLWDRVSQVLSPSAKPQPASPPAPLKDSEPMTVPPAVVWAVLGGVIVVLLGVAWFLRPPQTPPPPPPPPRDISPIAPLHPKQPMTLELDFQGRTWLQVTGDGKILFEGWAPTGAKQEWKAMDSFQLRTPTPDEVRVSLQGKPSLLQSFPLSSAGDYMIEAPKE